MRVSPGELDRRAGAARQALPRCDLCPRRCGADRTAGPAGECRTGARARVVSAYPHFGEEAALVGAGGSGTVFFSECNLHCVFCQNRDISHGGTGEELDDEDLARTFLALQRAGCANLNLVTPSHVVPQILGALAVAARGGLGLPIVFNTSAYDRVETLALLDGVVDVYLPDFKLVSADASARLLTAADYPGVARDAIREMHRQVGGLETGSDGTARRGLLVRHLVLPGLADETTGVFRVLADVAPGTAISVLAQYRPFGDAGRHPDIARRPTLAEIARAVRAARAAGLRPL